MVTKEMSQTATKAARCVHHWVVRPPDGSTSWGQCRKCDRRKRFSNRYEGSERTNNSDIFVDSGAAVPAAGSWKPDRRATYYEPAVSAAYEEALRTAS